jgi:membrane protein implicated in regulation of membrane protease activity
VLPGPLNILFEKRGYSMSRKTISTIVIWLGVIVTVTGAIALPLAQVNSKLSFYFVLAGSAAAAAATALRKPGAVRRASRAARKNKKALLAIGLSGVVLSQVACGDVGKKIIRYSDKGTSAIERLRDAQEIDVEDADRILPLIADARKIGVEYDAVEQAIKAATVPAEKAKKREQLRALGRQVMASLRRLENEGVLKIKNEQRRMKVRKVLVYGEILADLVT